MSRHAPRSVCTRTRRSPPSISSQPVTVAPPGARARVTPPACRPGADNGHDVKRPSAPVVALKTPVVEPLPAAHETLRRPSGENTAAGAISTRPGRDISRGNSFARSTVSGSVHLPSPMRATDIRTEPPSVSSAHATAATPSLSAATPGSVA